MKILPPVSIEARRLLPSRWDLLAAALVLGFIVAFADTSRFLIQPLSVISGDHLSLDPALLPGYALRTGLRIRMLDRQRRARLHFVNCVAALRIQFRLRANYGARLFDQCTRFR